MAMSRKGSARRMKREERIGSILDAARAVFEEFGYEGTKVAEIARRLDITEGNVYAYFDSKRDLMVQVIAEWYRTTIIPRLHAMQGIDGVRNRLRYVLWLHLKTMTENVALCAVVLKESRTLERDDPIYTVLHELRRQYTAPLMQVLADGVANGELVPRLDLSLVRNMVYGTMEHLLWDAVASGKPVDVEGTADVLADSIYRSIVQPAHRASSAEVCERMSTLLDRMEQQLDRQGRTLTEPNG